MVGDEVGVGDARGGQGMDRGRVVAEGYGETLVADLGWPRIPRAAAQSSPVGSDGFPLNSSRKGSTSAAERRWRSSAPSFLFVREEALASLTGLGPLVTDELIGGVAGGDQSVPHGVREHESQRHPAGVEIESRAYPAASCWRCDATSVVSR